VAVLASAITMFGNCAGRRAYMQVGATRHYPNLFVGITGETAKGRKGSATDPVEDIMRMANTVWAEGRIQSGLSSGEGVINEVRDDILVPDKEGNMQVQEPGVKDKRLQIIEGELAQALKVMKREGNTLSPTLRNAWDGKTLKTMVRHSPLRATAPHISIIGHITRTELIRYLTETETANGLANRFMFFLVRRSKKLPFGGEWHAVDVAPVVRKIARALDDLPEESHPVKMEFHETARPAWEEAYDILTEDQPGLFGAVTARAEAQTLRLAILYALADGLLYILPRHIGSALAVWQHAEASARLIFGDTIGDLDADKVLDALRGAGDEGMTRTEVSSLFGRNKKADELERVRRVLVEAGRATVTAEKVPGSSKLVEKWRAAL
jgi:hypothetical protein